MDKEALDELCLSRACSHFFIVTVFVYYELKRDQRPVNLTGQQVEHSNTIAEIIC